MKNMTEKELEYLNSFFSSEFDFNSEENLETYLYKNLFAYLFSEQERVGIIMQASLLDEGYDSHNYLPRHIIMIRNIITRLMKLMKKCDTKIVLSWLNRLQSNKTYAAALLCGYRTSGCLPEERWKTSFFRSTPGFLNSTAFPENQVFLVPDKNTIINNIDIDYFKNESWRQRRVNEKILCRRNKNAVPPFCMVLSIDKIRKNILNGYPQKKDLK